LSRVYDISRPLAKGAWTWDGDTPFDCGLAWKMAEGSSVNVGRLTMSLHCGTHIDAPLHFAEGAPTSDAIPLDHCIGPCEVIGLDRLGSATAERVLVRANGRAPDVATLDRIPVLKLFGTDWHSVDPMDSKTLDAHHHLWKRDAVILEELDLSGVPDGHYSLIALPLRLMGMDAAPVRAVLIGPPEGPGAGPR
jgi:arylformamidase